MLLKLPLNPVIKFPSPNDHQILPLRYHHSLTNLLHPAANKNRNQENGKEPFPFGETRGGGGGGGILQKTESRRLKYRIERRRAAYLWRSSFSLSLSLAYRTAAAGGKLEGKSLFPRFTFRGITREFLPFLRRGGGGGINPARAPEFMPGRVRISRARVYMQGRRSFICRSSC